MNDFSPDLDAIERRFDADFETSFPNSAGWEAAAVHVLLAFNIAMQENRDPRFLDDLKYAAMHALRWGKAVAERKTDTSPFTTSVEVLSQAKSALDRGKDYVEIFGAFVRLRAGIFQLERLERNYLVVTTDSQHFAYDVLDSELAATDVAVDCHALGSHIRQCVEVLKSDWSPLSSIQCLLSRADFLLEHRDLVAPLYASGYSLPLEWAYRGMSISDLRRVWNSLCLTAQLHYVLAHDALGSRSTAMEQLVIARSDDLISILSMVGEVPVSTARQMVELLTYDRNLKPADIALQPFVCVGGETLVASPWMILSADHERNFRALVQRLADGGENPADNLLAPAMAQHLAKIAKDAGFECAESVRISNDGGTDLDLVLWSPDEQFLLTAECKWMIKTADLMEVLNRGEKTAKAALTTQLPKHRNALDASAADIVKRAFGVTAVVTAHDSILICRGFCGTSRLPKDFPLIDDRLFEIALATSQSLQGIAASLRSRSFLPLPVRDYRVTQETLESPSGIVLKYPLVRYLPQLHS